MSKFKVTVYDGACYEYNDVEADSPEEAMQQCWDNLIGEGEYDPDMCDYWYEDEV